MLIICAQLDVDAKVDAVTKLQALFESGVEVSLSLRSSTQYPNFMMWLAQ